MNADTGEEENYKSCLHSTPNRNGKYLVDFSPKNSLTYLKSKLQKKGKLWSFLSSKSCFSKDSPELTQK